MGEEVPADIVRHADECEVPVIIKIMAKNNLTSRFIPYKEIQTAGERGGKRGEGERRQTFWRCVLLKKEKSLQKYLAHLID